MITQHTPGPWKYNETWGLIQHGKTEICALHSHGQIHGGNARLIAAAPDMLAALQIMDGLHMPRTELFNGEELPLRVIIDRAIAKATGGDA